MLHLNKYIEEFGTIAFDAEVCVNIKIDQSALIVKRVGNELKFYGREGSTEIDYIKRTISDIYEAPIKHIESTFWEQLPEGWEIHLENFNDKFNYHVKYAKKPKNNLIMSCVKTPYGNVIMPDNERVLEIAKLLDVEPPPVIFSGILPKWVIAAAESNREPFDCFFIPDEYEWLVEGGKEGLVIYLWNGRSIKWIDPSFTNREKPKTNKEFETLVTNIITDRIWEFVEHESEFAKLTRNKYNDVINFCYELSKWVVLTTDLAKIGELDKFKEEIIHSRFSNLNYKFLPKALVEQIERHWWFEDIYRTILILLNRKVNSKDPGIRAGQEKVRSILAEKRKEFVPRQKTFCDLFIGRFQPLHNGHVEIVKTMNNPVIAIVKGKASSKDFENNPFETDSQIRMIQAVFPGIKIIVTETGFIPDICEKLREKGLEVAGVHCGRDRYTSYRRGLDAANLMMPNEYRYHDVHFYETPRVTSATLVRQVIRDKNEEKFRELVPKELWGEWENLYERITGKSILEN
jgi:phosphopantetheine adenylyltransferase